MIKLKSFVLPDGPYYEMVKSNFERAGGTDGGGGAGRWWDEEAH